MSSRRVSLTVFSLVAVIVGGATLAWACTPQARIRINPTSGKAGSVATVTGWEFAEGASVSIRFDSASGAVIGSATGPSFSRSVTIPGEAKPGVYEIVAVVQDAGSTYTPSTTFQVVSESTGNPSQDDQPQQRQEGSTSNTTSGGGSDQRSGGGSGQTSSSTSGASAGAGSGGSGQTSSSTSGAGDRDGSSTGGGDSSSSISGATGRASGQGAGSSRVEPVHEVVASHQPGAVKLEDGTVVFGGSVGPATGGAERSSTAGRQGATDAPGFVVQARDDGLGGASGDAISLTDPVDQSAAYGPQLAVGAGLLALGLVGLFGGFLVMEVRRRRSYSETQR